jgi:hypothetical protein
MAPEMKQKTVRSSSSPFVNHIYLTIGVYPSSSAFSPSPRATVITHLSARRRRPRRRPPRLRLPGASLRPRRRPPRMESHVRPRPKKVRRSSRMAHRRSSLRRLLPSWRLSGKTKTRCRSRGRGRAGRATVLSVASLILTTTTRTKKSKVSPPLFLSLLVPL